MKNRNCEGLLLLFIFLFLCANSCVTQQIQSDFYLGLNDSGNAVSHFEKALGSSNVYVRQAAAEELVKLMAAGTEISGGTLQQARREATDSLAGEGNWLANVFALIDNAQDKEKVLEFLLSVGQRSIPAEIRNFVLRECENQGVFFSDSELAAIDGHFAVSRLRYNEALAFFRVFREEGIWPAHIPELFLQYPVLINDLGRAFQYTSSGAEGLALFLQWENNLPPGRISVGNTDDTQYRLLFFAARIARRIGQLEQALSLFEQALLLAPDSEQSDACIWYILDLSLSRDSDFFIQRLEQLVPLWHSGSYFNDVLERFLQILVSKHEWKNVIRTFNLIRDSGASIKAGYAWVIVRAIEENFLSVEEMRLAASAVTGADEPAEVAPQGGITGLASAPILFYRVVDGILEPLLRIAYDAAERNVSSLLYYRSLSAAALGQPFLDFPPETAGSKSRSSPASPAAQFLLGFFTYNAANHAARYINRLEQELSPDELRAVAQAFEQAGMYAQSIRLVSRYINRDGYTRTRRDMELLFPRPYTKLVEKYAAENSIAPEVLFGLIRTESAFQNDVVSSAGAVGLTQLMPATAREMADRIRRAGGPDYTASANGLNLDDPEQNIHIGAFYLNYLMGRFEDDMLSLLAYNGGMTRLRRWLAANTLPVDLFLETVAFAETRDYGRKVIAAADVYRALYYSH